MAGSEANAKMQNSKRKQRFDAQLQNSSKRHRLDFALKRHSPWNNLKLILCIQDKHLDLPSKVNQAFNFVQSRVDNGVGFDQDCETIKLPRLLYYLNDWILTLLFPPNGKENWGDGKTPQLEGIEAYMDLRCWEIFKFCLQESLKFHVSLSMSRNLLQTVQFVARNALSLLEDPSISSGELFISDERYKLYDTILDCVSLVFSSRGGLSNKNLDLWVETAKVLLELVLKMYSNNLDGSNVGAFALCLLWSVLQPFSKLSVHRARKGFHNFVDKLLEPLLHLSSELHLRVNGSSPIWTSRLIKVVEEVLSHGLFHPVHICEFLRLHESTIKGYPRHLFDILNKIITRKNAMAMGSLGLLFHLYVNSVRKFKLDEGHKTMEKMDDSRQPVPGEQGSSNNISAGIQKSLFNFFVLIMEPLLLKINASIQVEVDAYPRLLDLQGLLKSIGNLLASFMQEKVYVRTEDTSGGACLNFLKKIFNTLITTSTSVLHLSNYDTTNKMEIFSLPANEILVAMGYLLQIEYEVIGEDLVNLWLLMLSCSAINCNLVNAFDQCSLPSTIHALGCQTIHLYGQLRQVEIAILALCKAIRLIISHEGNTEESSSRFLTFLSNEVHSEAVERLLSSQKFIHAIYKAIESIPEGQVRGCIRQITDDISESLRWMKDFCPLVDGKKLQIFNLQVKLLGRGLSRLYCLVLGSVTITDSNRNLLGVAVKELMSLIRPCLSILVGRQPDAICKFFSSVIGESVDQVVRKGKVLKKFGRSSQWVLVFFFQLFVSCRSLYRQAISLRPPGLPKKMSAEVADYTAYPAFELTERIDEIDIGFFSWIVQPSASLLVVMQFVSDIYLKLGSDDSSPLIYIFQSVALQRLADLNEQIISFKYLQKKRYRSQINALKEEVAGLTNFIMENLSCVYQSPIFVSDYITCEDVVSVAPESNRWDLGVYVANKKSLPTVIWSNLCEHVDIWSNHASKKQLKKFFSHLLHTYLHCVTSFQEPGVQEIDKCKLLKRVTLSQISSELLNDSHFYEQKFAHRNLASMFCHALEKSVLPLFSNIPCTDVNLRSLPNWLEFLSALDNSTVLVDENEEILVDCSAVESSTTHSCDKLPADISRKEKTFTHNLYNKRLILSFRLLKFFRLLVSALLYSQGTVYLDYYCDYLRLFVSCRKALRYILIGFYEKADTIQSSPNPIISGSSFPVLWLSKSLSVVVGIKEAFSAKNIILCKSLMFSLMDHTSHVLYGIGKYQSVHVFSIGKEAEMPREEIPNHKISHEENHLLPSSQDSPKLEALKCLTFMAENLKEQMQSLLFSVHNTPHDVNVGVSLTYENINRLSSAVSCFSRFLWGLTSFMGQTDAKDSDKKEKVLMWKSEHASELNSCVSSVVELTDFFVNKLVIESNQLSESSHDTQRFEKPAVNLFLSGTNYFLVRGDHPEIAFLLRQLFIASSPLLRLNLQKDDCFLPSSFIPTFIEISQVLLLEFTEMVVVPQQSAFLLLDGALCYLRELAGYFPFTDPTFSTKVYTELIQIHMRAMGKTILWQGKRATLTFHEGQSSIKTLHKGSVEAYSSTELHCFSWDEFKTRLQKSFKAYIERSLHLLPTIQAIERSLVDVKKRCSVIYDVKTSKDGGEILSRVAAGIDCIHVIHEFVSGWKGLKMIKRQCPSLVDAVFNIIVNLQSLLIFYGNLASETGASTPDPGSAILMCVEVLVTVSRKHALFPMDVFHVAHLLHIPAVLFQNFHQLRVTKASGPSEALMVSEGHICDPVKRGNFCHVDHQFLVNLFGVCCQLLCTIIGHCQSGCKQCVAQLEASVAVLLYCLETVLDNESIMNKGCFSSGEGVKCACFLRRIYEEIKRQKDIFSRQCSLFLSHYIWVYSGYGPKRSGIRREVDEALRPGVYALIDACSVDDLQYLHTAFGGGMLTMTGDILPCFDASLMTLPMDTPYIITVPITLDVAANQGIIVAAETEHPTQNYAVSLVDNLLQKPSVDELLKSKAVLADNRTLLDIGIIAVRGGCSCC
ncbi:Bifunctional fucokinase/fucose pyrophosphorylase [Spatholobus suberectus]|nr:Bifunctional fucokinase/fucose pyrophosphorylase [Spatholobus suberectus]